MTLFKIFRNKKFHQKSETAKAAIDTAIITNNMDTFTYKQKKVRGIIEELDPAMNPKAIVQLFWQLNRVNIEYLILIERKLENLKRLTQISETKDIELPKPNKGETVMKGG